MDEGQEFERSVSFVEETKTAVMLLDEGIWCIAQWKGKEAGWYSGEDRRILGLFLTSLGLERFLKLTMTLILNGEGMDPSSTYFRKRYGHRLVSLLDDILKKAGADAEVASSPRLSEDLEFCYSDRHLREMLNILQEFGTGGRYHSLDVFLDGRSRTDHPIRRWQQLEQSIHDENPSWPELKQTDKRQWIQRWYPHLAGKQTETLQRTLRFLARLWELEMAWERGLGFRALDRFLSIEDEYLGTPPQERYF
ncbi:hypothetical protein [Candidatus Poriferisocius sp.]|uniref:hypothetical protein n=1 Tax=Candidatus Poriferisocius sp. TaxID=3101276 RepID=UPI003B0112DF